MSRTQSTHPPTRIYLAAGTSLSGTQAALALLAVVTLFRLWYCTRIGLVADEAYYWLWSKHLALAYRDKGPAIAWAIAAGTQVFGDTVFGVRWIGVLLSAGTGWQLFRMAQRLYDERTALWCLVAGSIIPLLGVGSVLMTIDSLSVFCWAWAANVFWTTLATGKTRHWAGLGLIIGVGFLAKFTNGVQLLCIGLFLLWSRPHRRYLVSRQSVAMLAVFVLCALPMIWWNMQVGWEQAQALQSRSGVEGSFHIRPLQLARFLGEQAGAFSPLIAAGLTVAVIAMFGRHREEERVRFLLCQSVPLEALFCFFSLNSAGKANWTAPALIPGIVLLVAFWSEVVRSRPGWRWGAGTAMGLAVLMTGLLQFSYLFPMPRKLDLMHRALGWSDFADHVQRARSKYDAPVLIASHYSVASLMQFYLRDHPTTYLPTGNKSQFGLWPGYKAQAGTRALFVSDSPRPPAGILSEEFDSSQMVEHFWSLHMGREMNEFWIYLLERH
jgi:4-amino-4-deoxy-L-arabinose transferase-like glycosyltransferase